MRQLLLLSLIVMAIIIIQTQRLRNAVIFLGVFSITIAFAYMLQGAPDVAIAEAVIGSTMSTILYVVAVQKYKLFRIYVKVGHAEIDDRVYKDGLYKEILDVINVFCFRNNLEPMTIFTVDVSDLDPIYHHVVLKIVDGQLVLCFPSEHVKAHDLYEYLSEAFPGQILKEVI